MDTLRKFAVSFVLSYLRFFARWALSSHTPIVIGITGSVGKSSVRNVIFGLISTYYPTKMVEKGNSETGIPLGILGLTPNSYTKSDWLRMLVMAPFGMQYLKGTKYLILEMGVDEPDYPKNMDYLLTVVKPNIAVFLNVYPVHTQQFDKTVANESTGEARLIEVQKNIAAEKGKIITKSGCSVAIYNRRNSFVREEIEKYRTALPSDSQQQFFSFGSDDACDISYGAHMLRSTGTAYEFWTKKREQINLTIPQYFLPKEYREVLAPAMLIGKRIGLSNELVADTLAKTFNLPKGRATVFPGINDSYIIDSSYNASKASVLSLVVLAQQLSQQQNRPLIFLFGDMRELGEEAKIEHEVVAQKLIGVVDVLYCVGPLTKEYVMPIVANKIKKTQWFPNVWQAGSHLKDNVPPKALILVKGSQNTIFLEEAIKWLLKNKEDAAKLCRQEQFWMELKHQLFLKTQNEH